MLKLKLIRGRSYVGRGVKASAERPFIEVDSTEAADRLVATGRFELISVPATIDNEKEIPLDKMTEAQLDAYAAAHGVDLSGLKKKADKLYRIQHAASCHVDGKGDSVEIDMETEE